MRRVLFQLDRATVVGVSRNGRQLALHFETPRGAYEFCCYYVILYFVVFVTDHICEVGNVIFPIRHFCIVIKLLKVIIIVLSKLIRK